MAIGSRSARSRAVRIAQSPFHAPRCWYRNRYRAHQALNGGGSARLIVRRRPPPGFEILQPLLITVLFYIAMAAWLGIRVLPFLILSALWANFQLTSANYVEHYGLLRQTLSDGSFERCKPHHSWNSNHMFSNWALFHLQRHSDHHTYPGRCYQSLRHFEELPTLPNGYFGMFTLAYFPTLWYRVMDPRLLRAVNNDPARINFQPSRRDRLLP
jgi:alkane 1-monooxygenase